MKRKTAFKSSAHNHSACMQEALNKAVEICGQRQLRFTKIRRQVFEIIWSSHKPITAYGCLKKLLAQKPNAQAPTIYRALSFLLDHSLIHKIESLNAFIGCGHPGKHHDSQFLICLDCHQVAEMGDKDIARTIKQQASNSDFNIMHQTIEIMGICQQCDQ